MQNDDLVLVANSKLGGAIGEQLDAVLSGEDLADQNPNALRHIEKFLRQYADHVPAKSAGQHRRS